jgi:hypothetical protein
VISAIMRNHLRGKKYAEKFVFKVLPQFSTKRWKYPKDPIEELFTPWQTVNGPKLITQPEVYTPIPRLARQAAVEK